MTDSPELRANGFFVITGGPGVGKTTLLQELERRLFTCIPEVARGIIKEQVAMQGDALPWKNRELYLRMMFDRSVDSYFAAQSSNNAWVFFDRGIPDSLTYSEIIGFAITETMDTITRRYRYNQKVFFLSPWRQIYKTDEERKQSWEEAMMISDLNADIYRRYQYTLIAVPNEPPEKRADFILACIGKMNL